MRKEGLKQPIQKRIRDFSEVSLGLSKQDVLEEAKRCLQCKNPFCVKGCPVGIDIPAFIGLLKEDKPKDALTKIKERNNLPAICGRVCPQENQCELMCVLNKKNAAINIGGLERYAADHGSTDYPVSQSSCQPADRQTGRLSRVVIVGSGPAGLSCAADLAKKGYQTVIFESLHIAGGVLMYGIPEFRLPKQIVQDEIEYIKSLGVEIKTDYLIGRTLTLNDLFEEGFSAVFIATGAGLPQFLGIPGENLARVYSANEFLTRINLMKAYNPEYATPLNLGKKIAVIGAGNVSFDCARVALRLNKKVTLIYRRTENEMPARKEELQNAKEEGVNFQLLTQPVKIIGDSFGVVEAVECVKMELGPPDESSRRRPIPVKDSNFTLDADTVIVAVGQMPNPLLPMLTTGLKTTEFGTICVDNNFMTSLNGVFSGGDIVTGADTVISAMGAGKKAAVKIDEYINDQVYRS